MERSAATSLALMVLLSSIASVSILYPDNNQAEAVIGFDGTKNLSTNSGASLDPSVSASGNNGYVAWSDKTPSNNEIILRASTDVVNKSVEGTFFEYPRYPTNSICEREN